MTKAELIRKISKRSGVPDSEAKVFFEILLARISEKLKYGEAIKLKGFGYFQLRQGIIKKLSSLEDEQNNLMTTDLIVFSPLTKEIEHDNENLIFNVPESTVNEYDSIDSHFSISINKPIIPLLGKNEIDYFIPPTGNELEKLFESKVEKILEDVEIITEHAKGHEVLIIKANVLDPSQFEFNWEDSKINSEESKDDLKITKEIANDSQYEHVEWDFGENLSRQIEEESILDVGAEPNLSEGELEELNTGLEWNFEPPVVDEGEARDKINKENENQNTVSAANESNEQREEEKDLLNTREFEEKVSEEIKKFQRVEALTSKNKNEKVKEPLSLTKSEMDLSWNFNEEEKKIDDEEFLKSLKNEMKGDGKKEKVKPAQKEDFIQVVKKKDEDFPAPKSSIKKGIKSKKDRSKIFNLLNRKSSRDNSSEQQLKKMSRRRTSIIFFIALLTIIVVGTALLLYLKSSSLSIFDSKNISSKNLSQARNPVLINREFDIPVSYPYLKSNKAKNLSFEGIDSSLIFNNKTDKVKQTSVNNSKTESDKNNMEDSGGNDKPSVFKKSGSGIKVYDNIYKNGNIFIVQVSSWKTESIAVNQAEKFKKKGFVPYVEKTLIPGRGEWFRVRIGNFKSLSAAKKFTERYK